MAALTWHAVLHRKRTSERQTALPKDHHADEYCEGVASATSPRAVHPTPADEQKRRSQTDELISPVGRPRAARDFLWPYRDFAAIVD
jgi:hypothetical protein